MYVWERGLQTCDWLEDLRLIQINRNYVRKRKGTANLRLIGGLTIDLDQSQFFIRQGQEVKMMSTVLKLE